MLLAALVPFLRAQDTFSIVAMDSVTGEVGSAGASCVGSSTTYPHGAAILSDVIPGIGVVHTQAAWHPVNQQYAHDLMMAGYAPQQIIDSLVAHDAGNNPSTRQYGIADLNSGHPRSAAYTGVNCMDYKNHLTGPGYAIQGNILLGQSILDSMEARFLSTPGPLADRLMAALQGAKVIGADTRCAPKGTSSQSAFLRVGRPANPSDSLYCDLWMAYPSNYPGLYPVDPIDSLQTLFDRWKATIVGISRADVHGTAGTVVSIEQPHTLVVRLTRSGPREATRIELTDLAGQQIGTYPLNGPVTRVDLRSSLTRGVYLYRITRTGGATVDSGKLVISAP
jgi:uncharacterized Ntn-hydrolase superfamily protein